MQNKPLEIERTFPAPVSVIWKALTDKEEMRNWYFDLPEFEAVTGTEFRFWGGPDEKSQYLHICKITEVIPEKKISYSWRYDGHTGNTLVSFELTENDRQTTVKLTHSGLETFPTEVADFKRSNFEEGWTWIIGTSLKEYIENKIK